MEQCEDVIRITEQQSEVSLQNHARSAGKWHVDSEVKMDSGPVVFPVLTSGVWDISLLSVSVLTLDSPVFLSLSVCLESHVELSVTFSWPHVVAALQFSIAWRFSSVAKCVQLGDSFTGAAVLQRESWGTQALHHSPLCSPWVSAVLRWQHPGRVRSAWLYPGTGSHAAPPPSCLFLSTPRDPSVHRVQVLAGICLFQFSWQEGQQQ